MDDIVDLERYPLHLPNSPEWVGLVDDCRVKLTRDGLFNLPGFLRAEAVGSAVSELKPVLDSASFTHQRTHNIYFEESVGGLADDHPALRKYQTTNHTICADQMDNNTIIRLYEWSEFAAFLAAVMGKPRLYTMADPLARVNAMAYREGEALNWHFDRSEFTTTVLLQAPIEGGEFEYAKDLRSDSNANFDGVARLFDGKEPTVRMLLQAGTLNVFRGKNTAHRVTPVKGQTERIIAVFSYFESPAVVFSDEDKTGFYGRSS